MILMSFLIHIEVIKTFLDDISVLIYNLSQCPLLRPINPAIDVIIIIILTRLSLELALEHWDNHWSDVPGQLVRHQKS